MKNLPYRGPEFFSDERILSRYDAVRAQSGAPHLALEKPLVLGFIGDLQGRRILDLGCGEAGLARDALERGAACYVGLDGSPLLLARARSGAEGRPIELRCVDLETWQPDRHESFDIAVSQLALHYVRNLGGLFRAVSRALKPGGCFVFSVEHPIFTSSYEREAEDDIAVALRVHHYFVEGERVHEWLDAEVLKFHRTLETYLNGLSAAGLRFDVLSEGRPDREVVGEVDFERRIHVPLVAVFRAHRS